MAQTFTQSLRPGGTGSRGGVYGNGGCGGCNSVPPTGYPLPADQPITPGIEITSAELGCTFDVDGNFTGKVIRTYQVNEDGTTPVETITWWGVGSVTGVAYSVATHGAWGDCDPKETCDVSGTPTGQVTDLSTLTP